MGPKPRTTEQEAAAFRARLVRSGSGCLEWTGAVGTHGYGVFALNSPRRRVTTHRYAYELERGTIPEGMFVCHTCDNRRCCEPAHLFLGNAAENSLDANKKGRLYKGGAHNPAHGEAHYIAKLTSVQVAEIRALSAAGAKGIDLSARFNVSKSRISMIINHRSRTHG